jgi:hypothetical protein
LALSEKNLLKSIEELREQNAQRLQYIQELFKEKEEIGVNIHRQEGALSMGQQMLATLEALLEKKEPENESDLKLPEESTDVPADFPS